MNFSAQDAPTRPPRKGCLFVLLAFSVLSILIGIVIINFNSRLNDSPSVETAAETAIEIPYKPQN